MNKVFYCNYKKCSNKIISDSSVFYCYSCGSIYLNPNNVKTYKKQPEQNYHTNSYKKTKQKTNSSKQSKKSHTQKRVISTEKKMAKILGLSGRVTKDDIKKSWRREIKKYSPDKVQNMGKEIRDLAEKKSKEINGAYNYFKKNVF